MTAPGEQVVGFVGIGNMGTPMITNLCQNGYRVRAYDLDPEARKRADQIPGCTATASVVEVAEGASFVITMLPNGSTVARVVLGSDDSQSTGIAAGLRPGATVVDMSSSAPADTVRLGAALSERGLSLVDAPVSGGVTRASDGTLAIFVGGAVDLVEHVRPLLAAMGTAVTRVGALGAGHAVKALNNLLSATCFAASVEVVTVAERLGLDLDVFVDVINAGTGRNNTTEKKLRQFVFSESFDSGFALKLMTKDIGIAMELAHQYDVHADVCARAVDDWRRAESSLPDGADHTEFARVFR